MMFIKLLFLIPILGIVRSKHSSNHLKMNLNLMKKLINDEQNESIKTTDGKIGSLKVNSLNSSTKVNSKIVNNRTGERFLEDMIENRNSKLKIKEEARAKPLLASLIDTLNVINSLNKTNDPSSRNHQCITSKCVLNCELQDQLHSGKPDKSGFCTNNDKATNICQCCALKHESCVLTQRRCKTMGLKAVCNTFGQCVGNCTCTINSCLQFCLSKQQKLIRSTNLARDSGEDLDALLFERNLNNQTSNGSLFYTDSISASAACISGQCVCGTNENSFVKNNDKPDAKLSNDQKINPIYEKMLLNNRRAQLYDSLQINFSNMLRMLRLIINSVVKPETYGLNFDASLLKSVTPSVDKNEKEIDPKLLRLENMLDNEQMKNELSMLTLNNSLNLDRVSSFENVFENRFDVFKSQRNLIISKLLNLVTIEKSAGRQMFARYLDDLRVLLASNVYLNHNIDLNQVNIDDFNAIFHLTLRIKNALQLTSLNLT